MAIEQTPEAVMNEVVSYVREYVTRFHKPVRLKAVSQHFAKRVRAALGVELRSALLADPRFHVNITEAGGYEVSLVGEAPLDPGALVVQLVKNAGGRVSIKDLKLKMMMHGLSKDTLLHLCNIGTLVLTDDWIEFGFDSSEVP